MLCQALRQKVLLERFEVLSWLLRANTSSCKITRAGGIATSCCSFPTVVRSSEFSATVFSLPVKTKVKEMSQKSEEELYFAYGSNLNAERMKERRAFFTKRETSKLTGYKLEFSKRNPEKPGAGFANIIATPEAPNIVHGILYTLEEGGLLKLDVFEGTSKGCYKRVQVNVERDDGSFAEVTAYEATESYYQRGLKPERWYLDHLLAGKDFLPPEYFSFLKSFETYD